MVMVEDSQPKQPEEREATDEACSTATLKERTATMAEGAINKQNRADGGSFQTTSKLTQEKNNKKNSNRVRSRRETE